MLEKYDCRTEYSVSGWVRWVSAEQLVPWNLIVRLSILSEATDSRNPGDRTLAIFKGVNSFHFATYSCD